jgi:capsid protein
MRKSKDIASIAKFIKTAAAGANLDGNAIMGGGMLTAAPAGQNNAQLDYYRKTLGGETIIGQPGEEVDLLESKSPSAEIVGLWDRLDIKIVQGSGISYAALCDYRGNWGGATLRAVLQSDNRTYELETIGQAKASQAVWEYVIGWAIAHGELKPSPDWRKVRWHPPRRTTVDVGNDSAARLEELKGGLTTFEEQYGETGEDWKERLDQRAREEAYIEELAKKYGIPRQLISSFAQERLAGTAPDAVGGTPAAGQPQQGKPEGGE